MQIKRRIIEKKQLIQVLLLASTLLFLYQLTGCGAAEMPEEADTQEYSITEQVETESQEKEKTPELPGLTFASKLDLEYAENFQVFYYEGGYALIRILQEGDFLVVPEGKEVPKQLSEEITILQQPLDRIYLAATATMAFFDSMDALDHILFSGTKEEGWYIENAAEEMRKGNIVYAGKYSEPDYEQLISQGADLSIQSTMIEHVPEVKEKLQELGIPVLVDYSSYETSPLGRMEWMKLYGVITGQETEAETWFTGQAEKVQKLSDFEQVDQTVAFFYMSSNGKVVVRKSSDYVPKMIGLAGGKYLYENLGNDGMATTTVNLSIEEFYSTAKDADYLVYNATIEQPLNSMEELLEKSSLFADFKAVQQGQVYCTGKSMYQQTDRLGDLIIDFHTMLTEQENGSYQFLTQIQ